MVGQIGIGRLEPGSRGRGRGDLDGQGRQSGRSSNFVLTINTYATRRSDWTRSWTRRLG